MNRHQRRTMASVARKGGVHYPESRPCVVCGEPHLAPPPHEGTVHWRGGRIIVPLDAKCSELWARSPHEAVQAATPRLEEWMKEGAPGARRGR